MPLFTSKREKRLWLYAATTVMAILSTLVLGRPLLGLLGNQNIQAVFFLLGMLLVGATIIGYGLHLRIRKTEAAIWLGLAAVYLMLFLRLGLSERSHLIEYSVLAIFIHLALAERARPKTQVLLTGLIAFATTVTIGAMDESLQLWIPDRVFDPVDIFFNGMAALLAIGGSLLLQWVRGFGRRA